MSGRRVVSPSFEIVRNGDVLKVVPVRKAKLIVGSDPGADLRLKHPSVAGRHIEIAVVGGKYLEARNLAGPGRLSLAGEPVRSVRLREGDELNLGPVSLRLTYQQGTKSEEAAAPSEAAQEPLPHDEPTDGVQFGSLRTSPSPPLQSPRAPFQDEPTVDGPLIEEPTDTKVPLAPRAEARTEAMPALARPPSLPFEASTAAPATAFEASTAAPATAFEASTAAPATESPARTREPMPSPLSLTTEPGLDALVLDPPPALVMSWEGSPPQQIELKVGSFEIGSGRSDLRLEQPGVAPTHALLMVMPDGAIYLRHLAGSSHQTLKDGLPVTYTRWLPSEALQIGPVALRLDSAPEGATAPAATVVETTGETRESTSENPFQPIPVQTPFTGEMANEVAPPFGSPFPHQTPQTALAQAQESPSAPDPAADTQASSPTQSVESQRAEASLVKVRKKVVSPPPAARKQETDLYVDDIELDYRAPLFQRIFIPGLVMVLLAVIAFQAWSARRPSASPSSSNGPVVASGKAPNLNELQVNRAGGERMVVGDLNRSGRSGGRARGASNNGAGSAGGYGGASASIDPANDWSPEVKARTYDSHGTTPGGAQRATAERVDSNADAAAVGEEEEEAYRRERARARAAKAGTEAEDPDTRGESGGGWVEMKDVEAVIYQERKKLRYCYSTAQEENPQIAGVMWLKLTLGEDGRIRQASLEERSTLDDSSLFNCLRRNLSTMAMPSPEGGPVSFSYPFEITQ